MPLLIFHYVENHRFDIFIYILIKLKYATIYNKITFKLFNYVFCLSIVI